MCKRPLIEQFRNDPKFSDRYAWQTVQTQIRLLLEGAVWSSRSSLIRVYTVCNSVCIVWTHYSITTNFLGVRIFGKFTLVCLLNSNMNMAQKIYCNYPKIWLAWIFHSLMHPNDADGMANSADPDQTAPPLGLGAVWSGSALFAQTYMSENLGSLRYMWESQVLLVAGQVFSFGDLPCLPTWLARLRNEKILKGGKIIIQVVCHHKILIN